MGNVLEKKLAKLKQRQMGYDKTQKSNKNKQAFKKPGSLNTHKQLSK